VKKIDLDCFEFSDYWLLLSIGFSKKGSSLKEILLSGDSYNHAMFSMDELNYGMSKLIQNGYIIKRGKRFIVTKKARDFYDSHIIKNEGQIATLFRMAPFFQEEKAKAGCELIVYFEEDSKGKFRAL